MAFFKACFKNLLLINKILRLNADIAFTFYIRGTVKHSIFRSQRQITYSINQRTLLDTSFILVSNIVGRNCATATDSNQAIFVEEIANAVDCQILSNKNITKVFICEIV